MTEANSNHIYNDLKNKKMLILKEKFKFY